MRSEAGLKLQGRYEAPEAVKRSSRLKAHVKSKSKQTAPGKDVDLPSRRKARVKIEGKQTAPEEEVDPPSRRKARVKIEGKQTASEEVVDPPSRRKARVKSEGKETSLEKLNPPLRRSAVKSEGKREAPGHLVDPPRKALRRSKQEKVRGDGMRIIFLASSRYINDACNSLVISLNRSRLQIVVTGDDAKAEKEDVVVCVCGGKLMPCNPFHPAKLFIFICTSPVYSSVKVDDGEPMIECSQCRIWSYFPF